MTARASSSPCSSRRRRPSAPPTVVNSLIQHYMAAQEAARRQVDQQANAALTQRLNQVRDDVNALESRIQQTRQKYELVQTRAGSVGQQQLEDLSTALTRASSDRAALQANYARATRARQHRRGQPGQRAGAELGHDLDAARPRGGGGAAGGATLADASARAIPRCVRRRPSWARRAARSRPRRAASSSRSVRRCRRRASARPISSSSSPRPRRQASQVATVQADLQQLEKDADARRALYQTLLVSTEQTETTKQGPRADRRPCGEPRDAAPVAFEPAPQDGGRVRPGRRHRVRRADRVLPPHRRNGASTDAEQLAAIDRPRRPAQHPARPARARLAATVVGRSGRRGGRGTARLRTAAAFPGHGPMPRSCCSSPARMARAASSVAAAFARGAAADGVRVLLMEGDLHAPSLAGCSMARPNGLVATLQGREHWREAVARDSASPLDALLAAADATRMPRLRSSSRACSCRTCSWRRATITASSCSTGRRSRNPAAPADCSRGGGCRRARGRGRHGHAVHEARRAGEGSAQASRRARRCCLLDGVPDAGLRQHPDRAEAGGVQVWNRSPRSERNTPIAGRRERAERCRQTFPAGPTGIKPDAEPAAPARARRGRAAQPAAKAARPAQETSAAEREEVDRRTSAAACARRICSGRAPAAAQPRRAGGGAR